MTAKLDVDFVRSQFPAFSEPSLQGQAFFENAGGSYTCRQVIDRLHRFYTERKVQPYGRYAASAAGGAEMDEARARLAALMNVETDELSFGPSTSQNTYVLAQAFADTLSPGDAVIVTDQDHEANSGAWRRLENRGMEIREWRINPESGQLELDSLAAILDDKVKLVCFPHCSNVVGQENPVAQIAAMAHDVGAVTCCDGVSYAPHGLPDVGALGTDIYLFSSYKTYGPHQGIMVVRRALADRLVNQAHFFNADVRYKRLTPAGPDHAQIAACAGMADYIDAGPLPHCSAGMRTGCSRHCWTISAAATTPVFSAARNSAPRPDACPPSRCIRQSRLRRSRSRLPSMASWPARGISTPCGRSGRWAAIRMQVCCGSALCITPPTPRSSS